MLSGTIWPAHPHPLPGECLSSWLVRCAHANGLKVQTFCVRAFGKEHQVWNRDIDRLAPNWLLREICRKTATSRRRAKRTTLRHYEKRLFPAWHPASELRWVIPLRLYHRTYRGHGMQYCPQCLAEDQEPYFRLAWRLALYTFCPRHRIMMHDRCHACGAPVAYHRIELGKPERIEVDTLLPCWNCDAALSEAPTQPLDAWSRDVFLMWSRISGAIERQFTDSGRISYHRLALLHHLCRLIASEKLAPELQAYVCTKTGRPFRDIARGRMPLECRNLSERHYILGLAWWLLGRTSSKLSAAISCKAVHTSDLYRDMETAFKGTLLNRLGT